MNTSCVKNCLIDTEIPIKFNFINIYQWPHSDAEFLKEMAKRNAGKNNTVLISPSLSPSSSYRDTFACRQRYLRSYTFSKKEEGTVKRTGNWFRVRFFTKNDRKGVNFKKKSSKEKQVKRITWGGFLDIKIGFLLSCLVKVDNHDES
ncbi:hypothetical protein RND81_11G196600 [Saponaria officinalis]|uniref:Uncharacterized protein n=1 Tax=Saponaria officinalis TaxID=3572 RepID=A0AAW1HPS4_SAPOF